MSEVPLYLVASAPRLARRVSDFRFRVSVLLDVQGAVLALVVRQ